MQSENLQKKFQAHTGAFNSFLKSGFLTYSISSFPPLLKNAVLYSLDSGGKKLRPILTLEMANILQLDQKMALPMAMALECLHTYSLIHDDLPSMDNDTLRRGLPTVHVKFGESIAILAGDALQALAFESLSYAKVSPEVITYFAIASGGRGMVGGQLLDIINEGNESAKELRRIHFLKTARIIEASLSLPVLQKYGKSSRQFRIARGYGLRLGKLFQIADDLLDIEGNVQAIGKNPGKDIAQNKLTYPAMYGKEKTIEIAKKIVKQLERISEQHFSTSNLLRELPRWILERKS